MYRCDHGKNEREELISIGNDIIALNKTNSDRTKQQKFYSKILGNQEIDLFKNINSNILSFENFVWLAWSVKESVYKFNKRNNDEVLFSPTKIIIQKVDVPFQPQALKFNAQFERISFDKKTCFCCEVLFGSAVFYTRTLVFDDVIFSVANNTNCFENICWGIKAIHDDSYKTQSSEVRKFALKKLNKYYLDEALSIKKTLGGYPILVQQNNLPISFSHHGKYVAYSFINYGK
ncbi:MAG: 4'-phosphopantetheinyl transferase superfamily protein [Parafilimonas sp.]